MCFWKYNSIFGSDVEALSALQVRDYVIAVVLLAPSREVKDAREGGLHSVQFSRPTFIDTRNAPFLVKGEGRKDNKWERRGGLFDFLE